MGNGTILIARVGCRLDGFNQVIRGIISVVQGICKQDGSNQVAHGTI